MESRNPQNVIRVTLWESYGKIGKVLVNLCKLYRSYARNGQAEYAEEELPERICHDGEIERILLETALRRELQGFTEKKRNILAELYLSGETETAVAQKYAVSRQYVNRLKREFRVQAEQYLC